MIPHQSPIDRRPFQAKSVRELQQALERHYQRIAIPELAAVLTQKDAAKQAAKAAVARAA